MLTRRAEPADLAGAQATLTALPHTHKGAEDEGAGTLAPRKLHFAFPLQTEESILKYGG